MTTTLPYQPPPPVELRPGDAPLDPPIMVPPTPAALPTIPDYVPPTDSGQPTTDDLNDLSQYRRLTIAAENTAIPIPYGRDRWFGSIFVLHIDDTNGFMYAAYGFGQGEIEAFETIFVDGTDADDAAGFLSFSGTAIEEHVGTSGQSASTLLSGVLAGFTDTYPNLAYLVLKVPVETTQGFPRVEAIIQGKLLYDPRLDDTQDGGTGPHRLATPATWEYSTNPTLAFYDFIRANTDWTMTVADVMIAADFNDEAVGGGVRHSIGLTLFKPSTVGKWAKAFRVYTGCYFAWEAGELRMIPNRADVEAQGAAFFDASSGTWINIGDQAVLDFGSTDDFTIEASFKTAATGVTQAIVTKKTAVTGNADGYAIYLNSSDELVCRVSDGGSTDSDTDTTTNFVDDEWHSVALVLDQAANTLTMYVDGVGRTPVGIGGLGASSNSVSFRIGSNGGGTNRFDGDIDEVRVWSEARSAAEVLAGYTAEIADPTSEGTLEGYWKLNDVTGSTAVDSSSNGNDGTLAGEAGFTTGNPLLIPEGVLRHFQADDIREKGFSIRKKPNRSFPTQVQVEYTDSSGTRWPIARQRASAAGVEEGSAPKRISKVSLPGIHNAAQAKRTAIERLNWFLSDLECTLPVFDVGIEAQHGSIVAVTHPIGLTGKLFRVRDISGHSGRWVLDLAEYDPAIYSNAVISDPTFPDTQLGDPLNPPVVSGLSAAEELYQTKEGNWGSRVRVDWNVPSYPFVSQYRVEGLVDGDVVWQTFVGANTAVSPGVEQLVSGSPITYDVNVYIHSGFAVGAAANTDVQIQGKLSAPGNVPSATANRIGSDAARLSWGQATDIDIWRYEVRQGTTASTWATASLVELVDGLNYTVEGLSTGIDYRFFIKAIDSVRNESPTAATADITLTDPTAVGTLNGFEVAGEVRLNWAAPVGDPYVERYRIAYVDYPTPGAETTMDITDSLVFTTKDVAAGEYTFRIYSRDSAGNESSTYAEKYIEVTLDTDAFLADSYTFNNPALTNFVEWDLRTDNRKFYVTNQGAVLIASPSSFVTGDPLANYHPNTASEWLSETKDFGLLLTGNWLLTHDVEALYGNFDIVLELSVDGFGTDSTSFTGLIAKGAYRYARVRISTDNPPGDPTAFVKSPLMDLKVNVVPLEESGSSTSLASAPRTITLSQEYTALKEIVAQPKNSVDALTAIVDNIVIGPNTGVEFDGTNYLKTAGDVAAFDFGTGDFSIEFWAKNSGTAANEVICAKKNTSTSTGYAVLQTSGEEIRVTLDDGSVDLDIDTTGDAFPDDGQWHHVGVSIARGATDLCKIRIDDVEEASGDISTLTAAMDNAEPFTVGARSNVGALFNGCIDELRIWSDVRTPAEFDDNKDAQISSGSAGLIGYWYMDGPVSGLVGTVQDETTGNNDLTDTGAGDCTYVDPGQAGNVIQKQNSFDVYVFDVFGQQMDVEDFQWKWKAV
jgi:hypothetical protein